MAVDMRCVCSACWWQCGVVKNCSACECEICGARCILLRVVLPVKFGLVVVWGVVFCEVCNDCG